MDTTDTDRANVLGDSDNSFLSIRPGDKVRVIHLNKVRIATVVRHSDGKVYCRWKEVRLTRPFSQVAKV